MAVKDAQIRARIDSSLKAEAEDIFAALGMNATEAITLFYTQVKLNQGLPFDVKIPNKETQKTLLESEQGIGVTRYANKDEMFTDLGI